MGIKGLGAAQETRAQNYFEFAEDVHFKFRRHVVVNWNYLEILRVKVKITS